MENSQPIANREEAVPLLTVSDEDAAQSGTSTPRPRSRSAGLRRAVSPSRLHEKFHEKLQDAQSAEKTPSKMQDRIFAAIFRQMMPQLEPEETKPDPRSRQYVQRPDFSLPLMSRNFRRFNSRIGIVFVFQNRIIRLFSWKDPAKTLAFLAVQTFCCLDPHLFAALPIALCVLFIMVPSFLIRHPPPPEADIAGEYEMRGPASALPPNIKPAPEMSKDFFRNMRDLQNCMEDFSVVHDRLVAQIAPLTNFADEHLSSTVFLGLFVAVNVLFIGSKVLPWRLIFLLTGWIAVISMHPTVVRLIQDMDKGPIRRQLKRAQNGIRQWMMEDIALDSTPERREVEIFELQHREDDDWVPWIYATSPYTPTSPHRVSGDRPKGSRFFEDVQPPKGWVWRSKKWTLDLLSQEWVEERMATGVEVEVEGERWVYDMSTDGGSSKGPREQVTSSSGAEWRRRRWVRTVQRVVACPEEKQPT